MLSIGVAEVTRAFLLLWLITVFLPSAAAAGGSAGHAGKGWVDYGPFADSPDQAFIRDYVEKELGYAESRQEEGHLWGIEDLHVGYHDLNDDGVPELFVVYPDLSVWFCGSAGCEANVFQMRGGRWQHLFETAGGGFWVSDEEVKGYRTLFSFLGITRGKKWEWTGDHYLATCVETMPAELQGIYYRLFCD